MSTQLVMPQLSDTMKEGTIVRWLKQEGDAVEAGEVVAEIESDKATIDFEAYGPGVMRKILVGEGEKIPVGQPIAIVAEEDEDISADLQEIGVEAAKGPKAETAKKPQPQADAAKKPQPKKEEAAPAEKKEKPRPEPKKAEPAEAPPKAVKKPQPPKEESAPQPAKKAAAPAEEEKSAAPAEKPQPATAEKESAAGQGDLAEEAAREPGGRARAQKEISRQTPPEDEQAAEAVEATESQMEQPGRVAKTQVPPEAEEEMAEETERVVGAGAESERYQDVRVKFGGRGVEMGLSQQSADRVIAAAAGKADKSGQAKGN